MCALTLIEHFVMHTNTKNIVKYNSMSTNRHVASTMVSVTKKKELNNLEIVIKIVVYKIYFIAV